MVKSKFQIEFHPESIRETRAAIQWYRRRDESVAEEFRGLIKTAEELVSLSPESWGQYFHGTRGYRFQNFPYVLVFVVRENRLIFVALAHTKQKPGYWKKRLF